MTKKDAIWHMLQYAEEIKKPDAEAKKCMEHILKAASFYTDQIQEAINPMSDIEIPFIRAALLLEAEKVLCVDEKARKPADLLYRILMDAMVTVTVPMKRKQ